MSTTPTGEESIIQGFLAPLAAGYPGAFGLTDDAALLSPPRGVDVVATMDAIAAGVHFFATDRAADIGWKAVAVNVSDLVAKGAAPHAYLMALSFPEPPSRDWLQDFARGLAEAQRAFGITLIGGDTDRRPGPLTITITALGYVPTGSMVRRGTAQPGDLLFVTGTLGCAALGLQSRRNEAWAAGPEVRAELRAALEQRYLRPRPRLGLVAALRAHATAAMDISDGLLKDADRMARASGVGAVIAVDRIPLSGAATEVLAHDGDAMAAIVAGGDDYEILAAITPNRAADFIAEASAAGVPVTEIGAIVAGSGLGMHPPVMQERLSALLDRLGYDHF